MPPPTRPFTTSSLTSTLKSTIASQPLLSNLTNIDKLSSQASSLAQKTPFFNNIANNISQNINQNSTTNNNSNNQQRPNQQNDANFGQNQQHGGNHQGPNMMMRNQAGPSNSASSGGQNLATNQQRPPMASTPTDDMSHLTEEERLMIQSVMAKAEMAEMGMPVDTSAPSSTNLPSNASQMLSQQAKQDQNMQYQQRNAHQQQLQQNLRQQQQPQYHNQQQQMQQQQLNSRNLTNDQQTNVHQMQSCQMDERGIMIGGQQDKSSLRNQQMNQVSQNQLQHYSQQQEHQTQQQPFMHSSDLQQPNAMTSNNLSNLNNQSAIDAKTSLALLHQQTQQTVAQINAQFNLNQPQQAQQENINTSGVQSFAQPSGDMQVMQNQQQDIRNQQALQLAQIQQQQQQQNLTNNLQMNQSNFDQSVQMQQPQPMINRGNIVNNPIPMTQQQMMSSQYQPNQVQSVPMMNDQNNLVQATQFPQNFNTRNNELIAMNNNQVSNQGQQNPTNTQSMPYSEFGSNQMVAQTDMTNILMQNQRIGDANYGAGSTNLQMAAQRSNLQPQMSLVHNYEAVEQSRLENSPALPSQLNQSVSHEPYHNTRTEIKFGTNTNFYDDQSLSDQEYHKGRSRRQIYREPDHRYQTSSFNHDEKTPGHFRQVDRQTKKLVDDKALQAYDLAHRDTPHSQRPIKSRLLPQPNQPDHRISNERVHRGKTDSKFNEQNRPGQPRSKNQETIHDSPKYLTCSEEDEEEDFRAKNDMNLQTKKSACSTKDTIDKSEEALRLISELKLTEQANQVMEQQQLLIKQSQELIKLQLEQQALSQELKKSIKQSGSETKNDRVDTEEGITKKTDEETENPALHREDSIKSDRNSVQKNDSLSKSLTEDKSNKREKLVQTVKSASICEDIDSDNEDSVLSSNKLGTKVRDVKLDQFSESDFEPRPKFTERNINNKRSRPHVSSSASQTQPTPKYNRELFHSPTDTTDSDLELFSQSTTRPFQKLNQPKTKNVIRRREPMGLPPSPLPVSAAIQLHQMQQQHFKQMGAKENLAKSNFSRSRSVTSSPSNHREHLSGYSTDNQRMRPSSPETLSEFGGRRRRKRLPEPPTNLVPLTPTMVRKMIQAQRAGASSSKLLTSVNAQSTLMTNAHMNRSVLFEKPTNDNRSSPAMFQSGILKQASAQGNRTDENESQKSIPVSRASDLNTFLSSTYGSSILKNNISDVKETPELDKIISNLDEYYGLDCKRQDRIQRPTTYGLTNNYSAQANRSGISASPVVAPTVSSWLSSRPTQATSSSLMRCNSEGEENLAARLARRSYKPYMSDHSRDCKSPPASYLSNISILLPATNTLNQNRSHTPLASSVNRTRDSFYENRVESSSPRFDWISRNYRQPTSNLESNMRTNMLSTSTESRDGLEYLPQRRPLLEQRPNSLAYTDYNLTGSNYPRDLVAGSADQSSTRHGYLSARAQGKRYDGVYQYDDVTKHQDRAISNFNRPYLANHGDFDSQKSLDYDFRRPYKPDYSLRSNVVDMEARSVGLTHHQNRPMATENLLSSTSHSYQTYDPINQSNFPNISTGINAATTFAPFTKDDIINNGPKFDSIGYRFRTENQNKYVSQARTPTQNYQTRYQHPYKRISLSKNPKDRLGNGIGMKIIGGQPIPSLYDKVNRCIVTSGAFVTEVFQNSNVFFMDEIHEGDQIIEWNGVNLCNRSDEEIQQILLSQLSDDEVDIVYLPIDKLYTAYGVPDQQDMYDQKGGEQDVFDTFARINRLGHTASDTSRGRYSDANKGSFRRKLSLSSFAHIWSK